MGILRHAKELQDKIDVANSKANELKKEINSNYGEGKETPQNLIDEYMKAKDELKSLMMLTNFRYGKAEYVTMGSFYKYLYVDPNGKHEVKTHEFDTISRLNDFRMNLMYSLPTRRIFETASNLLILHRNEDGSCLYFPVKWRPGYEDNVFMLETYTVTFESYMTYEEGMSIRLDGKSAIYDSTFLSRNGKRFMKEFLPNFSFAE
jgi:hypothetical protein